MKILHSADWQIGARFRQFGAAAARLQEARVRTFQRALQAAQDRAVAAFLIAGDLFEDNQIEPALISTIFDLCARFDRVPILILPGNHDPFTGPGSIWGRRPFATPPQHVKVFTMAEAFPLGEAWVVANPLTQKRSTLDPSRKLAELAQPLPAGAIKIGMTHGSPAIESLYQPDDFPIALDAATLAGLDYLALGHWHSPRKLDGGRMMMPGTPEPDDFSGNEAGCLQEVEIRAAGELPKITPAPMAEWRWRKEEINLSDEPHARSEAEAICAENNEKTVLRITLRGSAAPPALAEFQAWLAERLAGAGIVDLRDETTDEMTETELAALRTEHPLLGKVLDDLQALAAHVSGQAPAGAAGLTPVEFQALCESMGCTAAEVTPAFVTAARRLLLRDLREVSTC